MFVIIAIDTDSTDFIVICQHIFLKNCSASTIVRN